MYNKDAIEMNNTSCRSLSGKYRINDPIQLKCGISKHLLNILLENNQLRILLEKQWNSTDHKELSCYNHRYLVYSLY